MWGVLWSHAIEDAESTAISPAVFKITKVHCEAKRQKSISKVNYFDLFGSPNLDYSIFRSVGRSQRIAALRARKMEMLNCTIGNTVEKNRENLDVETQHLSKVSILEQLPQHQQSSMAATEHESEVNGEVDVKDGGASIVQCWHCVSPQGEVKGPYFLSLLKLWSNACTYAMKFKVWKTGKSQEEAIPLADVIRRCL